MNAGNKARYIRTHCWLGNTFIFYYLLNLTLEERGEYMLADIMSREVFDSRRRIPSRPLLHMKGFLFTFPSYLLNYSHALCAFIDTFIHLDQR